MRIPILKDILGGTEEQISSTDIVILITPRIVRTHELTQEHLNPIYIGSQMNLGLSGPTPVIGAEPLPAVPEPAAGHAAWHGAAGRAAGEHVADAGRRHLDARHGAARPRRRHRRSRTSRRSRSRRRLHVADAGIGADARSADQRRRDTAVDAAGDAARDAACERADAAPPPPTPQVSVTTPGPEFRVGGGPYTVPIAISNASRLSLMSVSLTYNPALVRVRSVQDGPFFKQGGVTPSFNQQVDANAGRVDISVTRGADPTGASGTGLLAALVFDAVAPGTATFTLTGVSAQPDGRSVPVTFIPATVTVR